MRGGYTDLDSHAAKDGEEGRAGHLSDFPTHELYRTYHLSFVAKRDKATPMDLSGTNKAAVGPVHPQLAGNRVQS